MSSGIGPIASSASALQQAGQSDMLQRAMVAEKTDNKARIEKASEQFEAMLLGTWLKEAEQSFSTLPGGDGSDDSTKQQMMSYGVQALSQAMAANGGIGIGKMIAQAMEAAAAGQQGNASGAGKAAGAEK